MIFFYKERDEIIVLYFLHWPHALCWAKWKWKVAFFLRAKVGNYIKDDVDDDKTVNNNTKST